MPTNPVNLAVMRFPFENVLGLPLTFDNLCELIKQYVYRDDARFILTIPMFIGLAERRITTELKILELKAEWGAKVYPPQSTFRKPPDWRGTQELVWIDPNNNTNRYVMQLRLKEFVDSFLQADGPPKYFCELSNQETQFAPIGNGTNNFSLTYYRSLDPLGISNPTNLISINFPELLLYGSLLETATYLGDDERAKVWMEYYTVAKQSALNEDLMRINNNIPNQH